MDFIIKMVDSVFSGICQKSASYCQPEYSNSCVIQLRFLVSATDCDLINSGSASGSAMPRSVFINIKKRFY
jgi:uncharacterized protein YjaZ